MEKATVLIIKIMAAIALVTPILLIAAIYGILCLINFIKINL
jgi:hypothetical protein